MKGKFYFVGTPIGNLKDFSINQIETLKSVDCILCEDTRTSRTLLSHYDINKKLLSFHKFNYKEMIDKIITELNEGKNFALISDAGMPVISDPGIEIIDYLKENEISYTVVGGVSAFLNAYILSGFPSPFTFIGFLPNKNIDRDNLLLEFRNVKSTLIFYSSVHKIEDDLKFLFDKLGNRKICITRELTKMYEEVIFTTLNNKHNFTKKGEFVVVVEGYKDDNENLTMEEKYNFYLTLGYNKNEAIKLVSKDFKLSKSEVYNYFVKKEQ